MASKTSSPLTVPQVVELCIEWANLCYADEIGWTSGFSTESFGMFSLNTNALPFVKIIDEDSEDSSQASCDKQDKAREKEIWEKLKKLVNCPVGNVLVQKMEELVHAELQDLGVEEKQWAKEKFQNKIKVLANARVKKNHKIVEKTEDEESNPGNYDFKFLLQYLGNGVPETHVPSTTLYSSYKASFGEFMLLLQEQTRACVIPPIPLVKRRLDAGITSRTSSTEIATSTPYIEGSTSMSRSASDSSSFPEKAADLAVSTPNTELSISMSRSTSDSSNFPEKFPEIPLQNRNLSTPIPATDAEETYTPVAALDFASIFPDLAEQFAMLGETASPDSQHCLAQEPNISMKQDHNTLARTTASQVVYDFDINKGYTLEHGPWIYKLLIPGAKTQEPSKIFNEADYTKMLRQLKNAQWIPDEKGVKWKCLWIMHSIDWKTYEEWIDDHSGIGILTSDLTPSQQSAHDEWEEVCKRHLIDKEQQKRNFEEANPYWEWDDGFAWEAVDLSGLEALHQ